MKKIKIATRGSRLSLIQVDMVGQALNKLGIEYDIIKVKTKADLFMNEPLYKLGKGVFEREVNEAVVKGETNVAVHSMKDLPSELHPDLEIFGVLKRDSPYDVLISKKGIRELQSGAIIGTSSLRRKNFITFLRGDIIVKDLRGNVDTRIKKYLMGEYNGIILAEASLLRLKIDVTYHRLNVFDFTPEPNQGIVAIIGRKKDIELKKMFDEISDYDTLDEALAEREAINIVGGGCHSPVGVLFRKYGKELFGIASYSDGKRKITVSISKSNDPKLVGKELGNALRREMKNEGIVF
ncbi:hydroxymethylbilane synthase [Sulfolobus sp. D5]|nr:hydroxymethylbilane synthase [Sulfolobus sp. D5]